MESERSEVMARSDQALRPPLGWGTSFILGLITLILGVIIAFRPTESLVVIAILLGVLMIVSGLYHIVRALTGTADHRVWRGISGALFILVGLVLIRHINLTVALIGLFIGFSWIIQGITTLMELFSSRGQRRTETGWSVFFGIISLIAGIVVISAPIASVGVLTIFMGAWFIVMGLTEMLGSIIARRELKKLGAEGVSVPQQRADATAADQSAASQALPGEGAADQGATGTTRPTRRT